MLGAGAVACVPLLVRVSGVPRTTLEELGASPFLMAARVLFNGFGSMSTSSLVAIGQSKMVMLAAVVDAARQITVVGIPSSAR